MEFLTGEELADNIYDTIYYSEKHVLILSPFIKLDEYFKKDIFETHKNNSRVHIIIGFGKNENNVKKSFSKSDLDYFLEFPNITIVYIPNLHAKYYGNEKKGIITSMNLIEYSFQNNIEFGVFSERKSLGSNKFFDTTKNNCINIINDFGYTIFVKKPTYQKKRFGGKDYVGSITELDIIDDIFNNEHIKRIPFSDFTEEKFVNVALKTERARRDNDSENKSDLIKSKSHSGNCIRCKDEIKLSLDYPLCSGCYSTWSIFRDPYYIEKYCISCGEKNNTSYAKPACYSCYSEINKTIKNRNAKR